MPDVELAIVGQGEEQVSTIRTYARDGSTLAHGGTVDFHLGRAKGARLGVEGETHHVVVQILVDVGDVVTTHGVGHTCKFCHVGRGVIELFAIGGPTGEGLEVGICLEDVFDFTLVNVVEDEVRAVIYDLHLLMIADVEGLSRLVEENTTQLRLGCQVG